MQEPAFFTIFLVIQFDNKNKEWKLARSYIIPCTLSCTFLLNSVLKFSMKTF